MKKLFFLLFVFLPIIFSYQLSIVVSDVEGIRLVGSDVSVFEGQNLINSTKTVLYQKFGEPDKAIANFDLPPNVYFVVISRPYFNQKVFLVDLNSNIELNSILSKNSSTYVLYGKLKNAQVFVEKSIYVLDKQGKIVSSSKIHKNGYFLLDYLHPSVDYRLAFLDEPKKFGPYFFYQTPGIYYLEQDLESQKDFEVKNISLSGPQKVEVGEKINLILKLGEKPLKNQKIILSLPSNRTLELLTDENGIAIVNAAEEGNYTFKYNDTILNILVYEVQKSQPSKEQKQQEINQSVQVDNTDKKDLYTKQAPPIEPSKNILSKQAGFGIFLVLILTLISSIIFFILFYILFFRKK